MQLSLLTFAWVFGLAAIGGVVSYLNKPEPKTVGGFAKAVVTSGFTGFLAYCVCMEKEVSTGWTTFVVGVVGMMGKRAWTDFETLIRMKFAVPPAADDDSSEAN